jgi:hypothetical protein
MFMITRRTTATALVILVASLVACTPAPPATFTYSGDWSGTMTDSLLGAGTLSFTLVEDGDLVTGTWMVVFDALNESGEATGFVLEDGAAIEVVFWTSTDCSYGMTGSRSDSTVTGTYASVDCLPATTGTVVATKE